MSLLIALPILIPLTGAVLGLLSWRSLRVQRWVAVASATGLLATGLLLVHRVWDGAVVTVHVASWPAPFGIVLVADALSAVLVALAGLVGLASLLFAVGSVGPEREAHGFHPLCLVLLTGVCGAFLTGDLFNLYVWFEVLLIASFVLVAMGGSEEAFRSGLTYVMVNLVSSVAFLTGLGLLYGQAGTLNMADLAQRLPQLADQSLIQATAMLFLLSFGVKAALFPLFFWLPSAYTAPPAAASALFAGLLTKVGIYGLLRVFVIVFPTGTGLTSTLLAWAAGATMLVGVLGAVAQDDIPRILAFHSVSQIGYMAMGLAIGTPLALAGSLFFIVHHSIVKGNLFLVGELTRRTGGSTALADLGGLSTARPFLAAIFLVPALSLAGIPPLSGFWAKLSLIQAGLTAQAYGLVAVALVTSLLTLLSMTKIWSEAFWKPRPASAPAPSLGRTPPSLGLPAVALASLAVILGLAAGPLLEISLAAANGLLDPEPYVQAILGGAP